MSGIRLESSFILLHVEIKFFPAASFIEEIVFLHIMLLCACQTLVDHICGGLYVSSEVWFISQLPVFSPYFSVMKHTFVV